jgi:hypothetical protein
MSVDLLAVIYLPARRSVCQLSAMGISGKTDLRLGRAPSRKTRHYTRARIATRADRRPTVKPKPYRRPKPRRMVRIRAR